MLKATLKSRVSPTQNVEYRDEEWRVFETDPPTLVKSVYTLDGKYIGPVKDFNKLWDRGIQHFEIARPDHTVCAIGYNPSEQKWYGWSHRAIYGFGVNSQYRNRQAKTLDEAKTMAREFAEDVS
jgi:hypothetical protein